MLLCVPASARPHHDPRHHELYSGNCVAYAREITGVSLDGNAASWWPHAEGRYDRGHSPTPGAILVFKPFGGMHVGHVAVVSRVVGAREILVDQANWVRGRVTKSMSVIDASPLNDWTSVKVQFGGTHGRENPTYGFIYPRTVPASFETTVADHDDDSIHAKHAVTHAKHHKNHHETAETEAPHHGAAAHRVADNAPPAHKHKAPHAQVAGVY